MSPTNGSSRAKPRPCGCILALDVFTVRHRYGHSVESELVSDLDPSTLHPLHEEHITHKQEFLRPGKVFAALWPVAGQKIPLGEEEAVDRKLVMIRSRRDYSWCIMIHT